MFVIERLVSSYREAQERWENNCKKWIEEGNINDSYNYRTERDYERQHPRPTNWYAIIGRSVAIGVCIALVTILLVGFIKEIIADQKNKPKKQETVQSAGNCQAFNKNDHVRIQYGDYKGNNGTIVGGCEQNQPYQVKLDDEQYANISGDNISEPVKVSGNVIAVDDKDNLVKIEVPEEKKEQ